MKKEDRETFFAKGKSVEELKAENIKNLKEAILLNRESKAIGENTIHDIYQQDTTMLEGKKDLHQMYKPLKKADESLTNMDGCYCTIS